MRPIHSQNPHRNLRGNVIILALVMCALMAVIVGAILKTLITEKHINAGTDGLGEARNVAEAATEVAIGEINRRGMSFSSLSQSPLDHYSMPDETKSYLATDRVNASTINFKAGALSTRPTDMIMIDPNDPFNASDPDRSKNVIIRHGYVYGSATATDPTTNHPITSYVATLFQIREQNWLDYAVFSNLDIEMHAGPSMTITGALHSNANIYVLEGSGNTLKCLSTFTTCKSIVRAFKDGGSTSSHTGTVDFTTNGNATSPVFAAMSTSQDTRTLGASFKTIAQSRWKGFVQDRSFSVPLMSPPGMPTYREDDYTTPLVNERINSGYLMIEPQLSKVASDDLANNLYSGYKGDDLENMKFSGLAGLTIRIHSVTPPTTYSDTNTNPGYDLVYYTGSLSSALPINRSNTPNRDLTRKPIENVIPLSLMQPALRTRLNRAIYIIPNLSSGLAAPGGINVKVDSAPMTTPAVLTDNISTITRYPMYDRREGFQLASSANNGKKGAYNTLYIDMAAFNAFIHSPAADWVSTADSTKVVYNVDTNYNNILYIQCPLIPDSDTRVSSRKTTDNIRPALPASVTSPGYAVMLINGKNLPQLASNVALREDGLTLATNGPLFIRGHYNADGNFSTGSATNPDSTGFPPGNTELASLVAADAVTVLSAAYTDTAVKNSWSSSPSASNTEISTAILSGVVVTKLTPAGGSVDPTHLPRMGGLHNFVRYLENWGSATYRYRGSISILFESEVATAPYYEIGSNWYSPPTRDLGYHMFFANGYFAPGMPTMRTVRRIAVADITKAQYDAGPPTPAAAGP